MADAPLGALLVMLKPDGASRLCTAEELQVLNDGWTDLLAWLRGADPDDLVHAELVGKVAQKAALGMVRFAEYDIGAWASQAADLDLSPSPVSRQGKANVPLAEALSVPLGQLGFKLGGTVHGWLNRVTIELLYRDAPGFDANRDMLTSQLLHGPVIVQHWYGKRHELALAIKLLTRRALSAAEVTNLVHIETVTAQELDLISRSMAVEL